MWKTLIAVVVLASAFNIRNALERERNPRAQNLPLRNSRGRARRSLHRDVVVHIASDSGKRFEVKARPVQGLLAHDFRVFENLGNGTVQEHDVDSQRLSENYLEGEVVGEPGSMAVLHREETALSGSMFLEHEVYTIENADLEDLGSARGKSYRAVPRSFYEDAQINGMSGFGACGSLNRTRRFFKTEFSGHPGLDLSPDKKRCSLRLVADHTYFKVVGECNLRKTIDKMVTQIQRVNKMFDATAFLNEDKDGYLNMGFVIRDVYVFREPTQVSGNETHFNMEGNPGVENVLQSFAIEESSENQWVCLSHLFTARNLDGALGLANTGHPIEERGICARPYTDSSSNKFLVENVGLSTSVVMGSRLLSRVSDLTVAHELAHGWGADHDPDTAECMPSEANGGLYLMSAHSTFGLKANNRKFSPCSIRQIALMLKYKSKCFVELALRRCGNFIVDHGEECDVGLLRDNDPCCSKSCKLRSGAMCSDMNDSCCDQCRYAAAGTLCRARLPTECFKDAFCSGESERCPPQKPLPDNESCSDKGTCRNGFCVPFCESRGLTSCLCNKPLECHRCCWDPQQLSCLPVQPADILKNGTMCTDGFCKQGVCRKKVQDFVARIVSIFKKVSPSWLYAVKKRHGSSILILFVALIWFPIAICLNLYDKRIRSKPVLGNSVMHSKIPLSALAATHRSSGLDHASQKGH